MSKFYGVVGYITTEETTPGVWTEIITERNYYGDVTRNVKRWDTGENLNDDLSISNTVSIVADTFAYQHFFDIRYISWMGALWKVTSVEVQSPRLLLTIGGVYNGPSESGTTENP